MLGRKVVSLAACVCVCVSCFSLMLALSRRKTAISTAHDTRSSRRVEICDGRFQRGSRGADGSAGSPASSELSEGT